MHALLHTVMVAQSVAEAASEQTVCPAVSETHGPVSVSLASTLLSPTCVRSTTQDRAGRPAYPASS